MELGLLPGREILVKKNYSMIIFSAIGYGVFSMRASVFDFYIQTKPLKQNDFKGI